MLDLSTPIEKLAKVGPRNLPRLKRLGIRTVKDLLWHFPSRYEDYTRKVDISEIREAGKIVSIVGKVAEIKTTSLWRYRRSVTEALIEDASGDIRAVWFNQPYIEKSLANGTLVSLSGKVNLDKRGLYLSNPSYEKLQEELVHTGRLVPVYPETEGITSKYLRFLIKPLLSLTEKVTDPLPVSLLVKYKLPNLDSAVRNIHFPESLEEAEKAKQRIAFDELFLFQLRSIIGRRNALKLKAHSVKFEPELTKSLVASLPFQLTNDQRVSTFEILKDLERKYPMNRLLNGDVGSGKTVVALIAANQTASAGLQTVFMAPTEILAQQHFDSLRSLSASTKIRLGLLTGSKAKQWPTDEITEEKISKKLMQKKIAEGKIDIVIGTHAVIQKEVKFKNLALVVLDEQHRFGVEQRASLLKNQELTPHLLSMTATPIPRTLALTIYGDLDISLIKEKPQNRKKIITKVINKNKKAEAYKFLEKEIKLGRQAFVICPRIELSNPQEAIKTSAQQNKMNPVRERPRRERVASATSGRLFSNRMNILWAEVKAVTTEHEKLSQKVFPQLKVAMLHGKMKPKEKEKIMQDFRNGKYHILVSTSVVEVGVDIPNASVMLIENAERFGLAQLHQFRGRVGRAEHQSYCLLVNGGGNQYENKRLKALENCEDGFKLAEQDLILRGPGEFVGNKQSGLPDLAMASLTDLDLIKKARLEAKLLLKEDPNLKNYPLLKEQLVKFQKIRHFE